MIMAVTPDLVHHDRLGEAHGPALGLTTELTGLIYAMRSFSDLTPSGVAGDARAASAATGETLLAAYAQGIAHALLHDPPCAIDRASLEHWRTGTALQFWGSEQYMRGIPLADARSWHRNPEASPWTARQVERWSRRARRLNAAGRGDEGAFVLRPVA